jgi:hypothetical protein
VDQEQSNMFDIGVGGGHQLFFALEIEQRWAESGQHQCAYGLEDDLYVLSFAKQLTNFVLYL